jgi:hypothetical protein
MMTGNGNTLEMSMKAEANGQRFSFAFLIKVESTKTASMVLRLFLKPNCSSPRNPFFSETLVMRPHILTVRILSRLEGIVIGRYCPGDEESPPWEVMRMINI